MQHDWWYVGSPCLPAAAVLRWRGVDHGADFLILVLVFFVLIFLGCLVRGLAATEEENSGGTPR